MVALAVNPANGELYGVQHGRDMLFENWDQFFTVEEDALESIVQEGHSLAYGARFLKRVIDDRVKLPISEHWADGTHFHVRLDGGAVVVDSVGPRLVPAPGTALAYGT